MRRRLVYWLENSMALHQPMYSIIIQMKQVLNIFILQMRLENIKAGRKGNLNVSTEVH